MLKLTIWMRTSQNKNIKPADFLAFFNPIKVSLLNFRLLNQIIYLMVLTFASILLENSITLKKNALNDKIRVLKVFLKFLMDKT